MNLIVVFTVINFLFLLIFYLRFLSPIHVKFKKTEDSWVKDYIKIPTKAYHKAACWDVYSVEDVTIPPKQWREIRTGITYAPYPHFYFKWLNLAFTPFGNIAYRVFPKSGLALKKAIRTHIGTIDNDYRNELTIIIFNEIYDFPIRFHIGDKLAQIEFYRVNNVKMKEVKRLSATLRGGNGFGSSGK